MAARPGDRLDAAGRGARGALAQAGAAGLLLGATSVAWFAGTLWPSLATLHRAPLAQAIFSFPSGRLTAFLGRAAVGLVYVTWPWGGSEAATIAFAVLLLAVPLTQLRGVVGVERRSRTPAVWAAAGISLVLVVGAAARLAFPLGDADDPALLAYEAVICAAGRPCGGARARWLRPPVADPSSARRDARHHGATRSHARSPIRASRSPIAPTTAGSIWRVSPSSCRRREPAEP